MSKALPQGERCLESSRGDHSDHPAIRFQGGNDARRCLSLSISGCRRSRRTRAAHRADVLAGDDQVVVIHFDRVRRVVVFRQAVIVRLKGKIRDPQLRGAAEPHGRVADADLPVHP